MRGPRRPDRRPLRASSSLLRFLSPGPRRLHSRADSTQASLRLLRRSRYWPIVRFSSYCRFIASLESTDRTSLDRPTKLEGRSVAPALYSCLRLSLAYDFLTSLSSAW